MAWLNATFVKRISVEMLFRVGDFAAMIDIVLHALAQAIRCARHGVAQVSAEPVEAGAATGCTERQLLTRIRLPLAVLKILLDLNWTFILAFSMLFITALVGTRDLGQEVVSALITVDIGRGLVASLGVAALRTRCRPGFEE